MNLYLPKVSKPFRWKKPRRDDPGFYAYKLLPASSEVLDLLEQMLYSPGPVAPVFRVEPPGIKIGLGASIKEG